MASRHIRSHCRTGADAHSVLEMAIDRLGLSARAYHRVLKISRTIADLDAAADIQVHHVSEAIQYRSLDRATNHP
jgi:magnesium chelatase family protein